MAEQSQTAAAPVSARREAAERMPRTLRRVLLALLAALLAGSAYLIAVRGEALIFCCQAFGYFQAQVASNQWLGAFHVEIVLLEAVLVGDLQRITKTGRCFRIEMRKNRS